VMDLGANVAEWVVEPKNYTEYADSPDYDLAGGSWAVSSSDKSFATAAPHQERRSDIGGFRCAATLDLVP
jgi:hypothetical protein